MDIKAQAELRRKKILANAEARLKKITGKVAETRDVSELPEEVALIPPSNGSLHNGNCHAVAHESVFPSSSETFHPAPSRLALSGEESSPNGLNLDFISSKANKTTSESGKRLELSSLKFDCFFFLTFGLIVRLLFYFQMSWILLDNIFTPFLVVFLPRLGRTWRSRGEPNSLLPLLPLLGCHQWKIQFLIKTFSFCRTVLQFFSLYLFSFVIADYVIDDRVS